MKLLNTLGWLASFAFGRRRAQPKSDFADMGTAFGLDASLMPDSAIEGGVATVPHDDARSFRHAI
jgi:hypothetical protein